MLPNTHRPTNVTLAIAIAFLLFGAFFRILRLDLLPALPNFAPVMAIAFCGALLLPGWMALVVPLTALITSDILLNAHYGSTLLGWGELLRYACYLLAIASGLALRKRPLHLPLTALTITGNAVLFYLVTNTAAWLGNAAYPQSLIGLIQSLTVGLPGFPPTWTFFRNSLVSDLLFTALILGAVALASARSAAKPTPVPA